MLDPVADLALFIDHTLLKPEATRADVRRHADTALAQGFKSVCVNSRHAGEVASRLSGSPVLTCVVIGFPLGAMATEAKVAETRLALAAGAQEIDMVLPVGALRENDDACVRDDIEAMKTVCGQGVLKVIIETCLLSDEDKRRACRLAREAGADFVKTSTGFSSGGATVADVALMRTAVGPDMGVKASGGIRSRADALALIEAGASRIGASDGLALLAER